MDPEVITLQCRRHSSGVISVVGHGENDFGCFAVEGIVARNSRVLHFSKTFPAVVSKEVEEIAKKYY